MRGLLKIFIFAIAMLLPCMVMGQETELSKKITPDGIKIDTSSYIIYNSNTGQKQNWGYIKILNNTENEYIAWIPNNLPRGDNANDKWIIDYFYRRHGRDFSLFDIIQEGWIDVKHVYIGVSFLKNILPGEEFTYMFIKTDTNMNYYKDRIVVIKRSEVEDFLRFSIMDEYFFPHSCIVIDME